ncbi:MAG: L-threonylcarbamoyladenylate synthase, partial [Oscillospiraceae bacterium]
MGSYNTQIYDSTENNIKLCAELIKNGEVCAVPTETVYGLAGNALDPSAVERIFIAKGRPSDNPLIVHISDIEMLAELTNEIPPLALRLAERFWPGPLTMIFKKSRLIPDETSAGLDTVGIRMPQHEAALNLIRACGLPLAGPSANSSGKPSPTSAKHVYDDLKGKIPAIIDGGECNIGVESTVISFENNGVRILRPGYVSAEALRGFSEVFIDQGVFEKISNDKKVISPGMKYKHYSPKANVIIVDGELEQFCSFVDSVYKEKSYAVVFDSDSLNISTPHICYGNSSEEQAHRLFEVLRELDDIGAETAYFRCPDK